MITPINTLPSGGYCKSKLKEITLKPLVLEEVNKYCSMKYPSTIEKMVWDIENLIMSIPGWEDLSAYDVTGLLFMRKYISATFKPDLKVTVKDKVYEIPISSINFKQLTDDIKNLDEVHVNGHEFKFEVPTIHDYYLVLKTLSAMDKYREERDFELINMCTCLIPKEMYGSETYNPINAFNQVYPVVMTSIQSDIAVLMAVSDLFNDRYNDITIHTEGGETAVRINNLTADMFRLIRLNSGDVTDKIIYKETVQS